MPENFKEDVEIIIKIGSIYKIFVTVIIFGRELCFIAMFLFYSRTMSHRVLFVWEIFLNFVYQLTNN